MLARGMRADSVINEADEAEVLRRDLGGRVERINGAGHSLQGDPPTLVESFAIGDDR